MILARPLLAFKRDLSRPTSETRVSTNQETVSSSRTYQESSSSSPLEIIDIDTSNSFKSILDKVRNSLSPSTKRRESENPNNDATKTSSKEDLDSSSNTILASKKCARSQLRHKSVSFADNIDSDDDSDIIDQYSIDDRNEIIRNAHTLADQILNESIDVTAAKAVLTNKSPNKDNDNFAEEFNRIIKPRRISINNVEDLVYQDLSAEIVAYVLKHALRTLKKEQDEEMETTVAQLVVNHDEQNEDFIDLK